MNSPLTSQDFASFIEPLSPFEPSPTVAVAVSGGADSLCLLLLAHEWAKGKNGRAVALTVDHRLRPESAIEAKQVAALCHELGIEHHILIPPQPISGGIQANARTARYELLTGWCKAHHVLHLLTAHHRDDQAETFFFRLARGSQMDGLAAIAPLSTLNGVRLLRPLLSIPKSCLEANLHARQLSWIEDPSNSNPRFSRTHLRSHLALSEPLSDQAAQLAERFGAIRNRLENKLVSYSTNSVSIYPEAYATLQLSALQTMPPDIALRLLSSLTLTLTGDAYPPRSEKLERLYRDLLSDRMTRRSFAGLIFAKKRDRILITREPAAIAPSMNLLPGTPALWDHRFEVTCAMDGLRVEALGLAGMRQLQSRQPELLRRIGEKPVLKALPAFWHLEELVAVPHISYRNPRFGKSACTARFKPAKALGFPAFFSTNATSNIYRECA